MRVDDCSIDTVLQGRIVPIEKGSLIDELRQSGSWNIAPR